jgi:hypothetical protein
MVLQISEKVKPHPVVITLLTQVEELIPTWKIVPTKDVIDSAFKDPVKREKVRHNPSVGFTISGSISCLNNSPFFCTRRADQEEQAHLPGQAAAQDGAGTAENQHGCRGQLVRGTESSGCFLHDRSAALY